MVLYPENPRPSIRKYASVPKDNVNESILTPGSHTGTHVDSGLHIREGKEGVESLSLESFYGKCRVFDLTNLKK